MYKRRNYEQLCIAYKKMKSQSLLRAYYKNGYNKDDIIDIVERTTNLKRFVLEDYTIRQLFEDFKEELAEFLAEERTC